MDTREFQIQVYPLKDKLFRFARRILEHNEEAEDVVQEVFIRLWNKRESLKQYRSIEALAMISTKNMCLDRIKKRKYPVESLDDQKRFIEGIPMEPKADYSDELHYIRKAMESLPEQQKMIVQLRDIEEYEFETIAEILNMNENAIRVNLSRARKKIRETVIKYKLYEVQRN